MQEEKYEKTLALSQSAIKDFRNMHPLEWKKIWITKEKPSKKSVALGVGSLVDDLLFNPSCVEDKYIIHEAKKPSASISYIVENVFINAIGINPDVILAACRGLITDYAKTAPMPENKIGYGQSWKEDTMIDKVIKEGEEYFDFLKSTKGKYIIQNTDYIKALIMAENTKKSELVKPYLDPEFNDFQFQIVTNEDFPEKLKGCLDIKYHKDNKIRVVDFKTADSAYYFETNVRKFGYLEQVTFYDNLLRYWYLYNNNSAKNTMLPPINIVIDSIYATPYIYEYNWKDIDAAWNGYFKYGKWQKGLKDWIKEIQWHLLNDAWDYPMEHYLYGKINLNLISHKPE